MSSTDLDVAVIGAGPAGLAVAHALQKAGRTVQVFEVTERVGGRMRTLRQGGYLIDEGAEMLAARGYEHTWRLIREMGIPETDTPHLAGPLALWRADRAHPYLAHPLGLITGAGLSLRARWDFLRFNALVRSMDPDHAEDTALGETTLAELVGRYRPELHDYLFQPVAGGFFGWDTERSAAGPFAAHVAATGTARTWRTYSDGMDTLCRRLAERLSVRTGTPVREVVSTTASARLKTDHDVLSARSVVLAVPAPAALELHVNAPDDERTYLEACTFVPRLRLSCLLDRPLALRSARQLCGLLIPAVENPILAAITFDHNKCRGRAPVGRGLVTLLAGPEATRRLIDAPDEEVVRTLAAEGERYVPGLREATRANFVHRFRDGMPEATPAALRLRPNFMRRPTRPVEYAGDWVLLRPCSEGAVRSARLCTSRIDTGARPARTPVAAARSPIKTGSVPAGHR